MSKYKSIKIYLYIYFFHNIRMEPASQNNDINAFKEIRKFFNEHREVIFYVKKQMKLEKNQIKRMLSIIFKGKRTKR